MKKMMRSNVTNQGILAMVFILKKFYKTLTVLGVIGMLWSYVPWQLIDAQTTDGTVIEETVSTDIDQFPDYPTTTDSDFDPSLVEIESEVLSDRTASTKTFRKIDGTYETAMYNDVIHYLENGEWIQVDNSLNDLGDELETNKNKFKLKFPKSLDDNKQIKLTMDGYGIDWNVLNISSSPIEVENEDITPSNIKELVNITQSVLYRDIQNNVDIEYIVTGSKVKENIILNHYVEDFSMTFEYKLKDLTLIEVEDGDIVFINENNEVVFVFGDLFMTDNDMNESFDINFSLIETGNKTYVITLTPSDEWLQTAVYPVVIDPSLVLDASVTNGIRDKYTYNTNARETYNYLLTGKASYEYKTYIEMSLSALPNNAIINYAQLRLETYYSSTYNHCDTADCQINLRAVNQTSDWDDITSGSFSDVHSTIIDYEIVEVDDGRTYYYWDFVKIVREWYEDNATEGIVEISHDDVSYTNFMYFSSEEYGTVFGPRVTIGYQTTTGLYNYWTYHDAPVGDAGTAFINDYTGELNFIRNDYTGHHSGMNLNLSMFYSENLKNINTYYGMGWRTNYDSTAHFDTDRKYIVEPSGAEIEFYQNTCSSVTDVDLIKNSPRIIIPLKETW